MSSNLLVFRMKQSSKNGLVRKLLFLSDAKLYLMSFNTSLWVKIKLITEYWIMVSARSYKVSTVKLKNLQIVNKNIFL